MAENSKIEWTDHTFNPWWGCQKVSPACDHCYAERDAKRFAPGKVLWGVGSERRTFGDKHWEAPIKWNDTARASAKKRAAYGLPVERPRVFCASMADWLDLDAPIGEFVKLLDLVRVTPELDWLLLSKRIGNWRKRIDEAGEHAAVRGNTALSKWVTDWLRGDAPANVWLGATVVNQEEADRDIPKLLQVPARMRFLSIEPMLGAVDLREIVTRNDRISTEAVDALSGELTCITDGGSGRTDRCARLDWVICGGESGPGARPMHAQWARSLRDQCKAAGVPFLFKQWGEWLGEHQDGSSEHQPMELNATDAPVRVGKKAAGRLLDGVQHDGFPA